MECGFDMMEAMNGEEQILQSIMGFWNAEEGNFTKGGTGVKVEVMKNFKNGEYPNASPEDVKSVFAQIDAADPSGQEQNDVLKLAGVNGPDQGVDEGGEENVSLPDFDAMFKGANAPKISFGGQDFDTNNPDEMGNKIKNMLGGMMKGVQGQVPNQNVQIPGGQLNPNDMMKQIMQKINFGN